ncbi:MAG: rhodanese-like domain-containing protein, partial [Spirochaetales bacterium]|nr:rhodanese-like domain-containing protein [Spirochaetales bacterium]
MTLIDIRSAADYAKGHLKGAINLPWGTTAMSDNLKYLPHDGQVFVYCYT